MDLLPNDVRLIVYRYIHLDAYRKLMDEYNEEWALDEWCDECSRFDNNTSANWRDLSEERDMDEGDCVIGRFHGDWDYHEHDNDGGNESKWIKISPNYFHAKLYL